MVVHAGKTYYEELVLRVASSEGVDVEIPNDGLAFGETLSWYDE